MAAPSVIILDDPPAGYAYTQKKDWRERAKLRLNSRLWQWFIIALVITDACLVATDIILSSVYCGHAHPPHKAEVAEEWLRYASIFILSFFVLEWIVEAFVHGFRRWVRTPLHLMDLIIVAISLVLEVVAISISETAVEVGGLLVVFRLWRVVRVMHAVGEVEHKKHEGVHSDLEMANLRLQQIAEAHHAVIKEMHHQYTSRMNAMRAKMDERPKNSDDTAPTLDEVLTAVSKRSAQLQRSVTLHRQSMQYIGSGELPPVALTGARKLTDD